MLGFCASAEFPSGTLPVHEPLVSAAIGVSFQAEMGSDLMDAMASPDVAVVFVAEIYVGTIVEASA